MKKGAHIMVTGIVQGVGFRPFVYSLATRLKLNGWVRNTSAGVEIEVDGSKAALERFVRALSAEAPALACIEQVRFELQPAAGHAKFEILESAAVPAAYQPIPADVSICPDCLRELFDPSNRRYRYPFINCTNCGPRFTIIQDLPYDRPKTTMSDFPMCPDCAAEYNDPLNRRFHAQPVACPNCGPRIWLEQFRQVAPGRIVSLAQMDGEAIHHTLKLLAEGKIVAIKGLGGFHLACDALNPKAVAELRRRKLRVDKPFALMMPDLDTIARHCVLSEAERRLLESPARPIVLLRRRPESAIVSDVAPGQTCLGVMLPYTPLHYLLMQRKTGSPEVLVLTSGNRAEEPICTDNADARTRLAELADAFLVNNRDIHIRADDSVVRVYRGEIYPIRRSRGYAPFPVRLPWDVPPLLATGAELKNTFCITNQNYAFLSHHIGDLENYETLRSFEEGVTHFEKLFKVQPAALACDLHPDYLATRYALERAGREGLRVFSIQHHHAHIAAVMSEHGLDGSAPVLGVAFDGTGYGEDGAIWGGEFLVADYAGFRRAAHLSYFPLPGGDAATRNPARTAVALLHALGLEGDDTLAPYQVLRFEERLVLLSQLERGINSPLTSSMGRLFDAVAALAGVRQQVNYEAQAAIEFEALADPNEARSYTFEYSTGVVNPRPAVESLLKDVLARAPLGRISGRFHNGLAEMVRQVCAGLRTETGIAQVALSGGVWQNLTLLAKTVALLEKDGFSVLVHRQVPANDGGLALGQAAIAAWKINHEQPVSHGIVPAGR